MKRRTKDKVGQWPNMRDDTLRAICDELIRARKKHPMKDAHLVYLFSYANELKNALNGNTEARVHNRPGITAVQIYALAATVATMAIRIMEEGALPYAYEGNTAPPAFELTP